MRRRVKESKLENIVIIVSVVVVLTLMAILIITTEKEEEIEDNYLGWMEGIVPNDYMNVNDFSKNVCGKQYYTSLFKIVDNKLYDYRDNLIGEKMFTLSPVTYSACEVQLMFVTNTDGEFFYINNSKDSELKMYELVKIPEVKEIVRLAVNHDNHIIGYNKDDSETDLTDLLNDNVNLEEITLKK